MGSALSATRFSSRALLAAVLLAVSVVAEGAATEEGIKLLQTQLEVEQELWESSVQRLRVLRRQEERQRARAAELASRLDAQLAERSASISPDQLEEIEDAATIARQTAEALADRAAQIRQTLFERWRRMETLEVALEGARNEARPVDPLSGTWRIVMVPSGSQGLLELKLDGTLVGGAYHFDGGFRGSLRGTFVGRAVKLERIDSERGFDIIYEGRLANDGERIDGAWRSTLLSGGGPAGGTWSAQKQAQ